MDCASADSEIRRAVEGIARVRAMTAQLGHRTLALGNQAVFLVLAVCADMGASLQVLINGLRLLNARVQDR